MLVQLQVLLVKFKVVHIDFHRAKNLTANILKCITGDCDIIKTYSRPLECSYAEDWEIRNKLSQGVKFIEVLERLYL